MRRKAVYVGKTYLAKEAMVIVVVMSNALPGLTGKSIGDVGVH